MDLFGRKVPFEASVSGTSSFRVLCSNFSVEFRQVLLSLTAMLVYQLH